MSHWIALLPVCHDTVREPGAAPRMKKRKVGTRTVNHRRIPQETVRAMRSEYEALPKDSAGKAPFRSISKMAAKYGICIFYLRRLILGGIRDDEREPAQ